MGWRKKRAWRHFASGPVFGLAKESEALPAGLAMRLLQIG
jgi:hypothetical protein